MALVLTESELKKQRGDEKIVRETAAQVIKDFAMFGMEVAFPENIHWAYDELFEQLNRHIGYLLGANDKMLLSLLYQIDVSEKSIRKGVESNAGNSLSEVVTSLVLERELKKVITRNYFKEQGT
ncbi:MAG: hypothetical protein JXB34_11210 [Bacteroidales bacterium]|nr:hypothetical protein [Bacteroidales bacterium]